MIRNDVLEQKFVLCHLCMNDNSIKNTLCFIETYYQVKKTLERQNTKKSEESEKFDKKVLDE